MGTPLIEAFSTAFDAVKAIEKTHPVLAVHLYRRQIELGKEVLEKWQPGITGPDGEKIIAELSEKS